MATAEYHREWRRMNRERHLEVRRAHRVRNREKLIAQSRTLYQDGGLERARNYREDHREAVNAQARAGYAANREAQKARMKKWRSENKELARELTLRWEKANPEKARAVRQSWRERNRDRFNAIGHRYRARKRGLASTLTPEQWGAIKQAYGHCCAYCGGKPKVLAQDHVVPVSKGGGYTPDNIVPACSVCNGSKGNRPPSIIPSLRLMV